MAEHCPLKRCAVPEDVARVVAFLSSEDGGWVNGKSYSLFPQHLSPGGNPERFHDLRWYENIC